MKFYSPNKNLKVLVKTEKLMNYGGIMSVADPAVFAQFRHGYYETEDLDIIAALKRADGYSDEPSTAHNFWPWKDPTEPARKQAEYIKSLEDKVAELEAKQVEEKPKLGRPPKPVTETDKAE